VTLVKCNIHRVFLFHKYGFKVFFKKLFCLHRKWLFTTGPHFFDTISLSRVLILLSHLRLVLPKRLFPSNIHVKFPYFHHHSIEINRNVNVKESEKRFFLNSKFIEKILIFFQYKIIFTTAEFPSPTQALTYLHCVTVTSRTILPDYS